MGNGMLLSSSGATTIDTITTPATSLVTWVVSAMTSLFGWVTSTPYTLLLACMLVVGFAVGLMTRIIRML